MYFGKIFTINSKRIFPIFTFYIFLYGILTIFIIQFLIINSYGINDETSGNVKVVDKIALDITPQCIENNPDNGNMYVPSQNGVYVINSSNNEITKIVPINITTVDPILQINFEGCIEYNPDNGNMYVPSQNGVYVINSSNNEVSDFLSINTSERIRNIAFNEEEGNLYVITNGFNEHSVAHIINGTNDKFVDLLSNEHGFFLKDVKYNPGNGYVYLTDGHGAFVDFIKYSGNDRIKENLLNNSLSWNTFRLIDNIYYNEYNNTLYVSIHTNLNNSIIIANATDNTLLDIMPFNGTFIDMDFNPKNGFIYGTDGYILYVINPLDNFKIINKIITNDGFENRIAFNPKNSYMYLTNPSNNTISVIS